MYCYILPVKSPSIMHKETAKQIKKPTTVNSWEREEVEEWKHWINTSILPPFQWYEKYPQSKTGNSVSKRKIYSHKSVILLIIESIKPVELHKSLLPYLWQWATAMTWSLLPAYFLFLYIQFIFIPTHLAIFFFLLLLFCAFSLCLCSLQVWHQLPVSEALLMFMNEPPHTESKAQWKAQQYEMQNILFYSSPACFQVKPPCPSAPYL